MIPTTLTVPSRLGAVKRRAAKRTSPPDASLPHRTSPNSPPMERCEDGRFSRHHQAVLFSAARAAYEELRLHRPAASLRMRPNWAVDSVGCRHRGLGSRSDACERTVLAFELLDVETWGAIAAGLLVGYIAYRSVALWLARRHPQDAAPAPEPEQPPEPPPSAPANQPPIDPFTHGAGSEKRKYLRRKGSPITVLISDAKAKEPPRRGAILDRSQGGLRLLTDGPINPGTIISVLAEHAASVIPWTQMEVRRCQHTATGWEWGCKFLHPVPSTVMWLFG